MASTSGRVKKTKGESVTVVDGSFFIGAIQEQRESELDVVPEGYHRLSYYSDLISRSKCQAGRLLNDLIDAGKAEAKKFRILRRDGRPDDITHYKIYKNVKKE